MIRLIAIVSALLSLSSAPPGRAADETSAGEINEAALAIHREALIFDGHNDLPWQFRRKTICRSG